MEGTDDGKEKVEDYLIIEPIGSLLNETRCSEEPFLGVFTTRELHKPDDDENSELIMISIKRGYDNIVVRKRRRR